MSDRISELFRRWKTLLGALRRFGLGEADAEEVAQQTLFETWRRIDQIKPGGEWAYWWTAAHNRGRSLVTRTRTGDPLSEVKAESRSAEEALIAEETEAAVHEALSMLDAMTREFLIMKSNGYTYREIAAVTGTTWTAVQSRIHRGIVHLRERLGAGDDHNDDKD
jgi:RNA polymerase sigma-70 factor (ECF subfamily)